MKNDAYEYNEVVTENQREMQAMEMKLQEIAQELARTAGQGQSSPFVSAISLRFTAQGVLLTATTKQTRYISARIRA